MFVVDTNILLYAADRDAPEHVKCRSLLQSWRKQSSPWYLTWGIVYDFLRVATHPHVFRKPFGLDDAWTFVEAVLAAPSVGMLLETEHHQQVAAEVFAEMPDLKGNLALDAHTAILMREHGIKAIYTRDTDFNRFGFLDVIDPISESRRTSGSTRRGRPSSG
jgi:toxin-antitoxin system PIN domain toxin